MSVSEEEFKLPKRRVGILESRLGDLEHKMNERWEEIEANTVRISLGVMALLYHNGRPQVTQLQVDEVMTR